ncbi:MAG: FHA domain-containing protein, partial [Nitrospina sp.]|nr:FHA domain-containing protein [Nitrospina sp.]
MRCLIRNITRKRSGLVHDDKPYTSDHISIGRAPAHQIFLSDLRVALNHARVTQTPDGKFQIQAQALSGVRINSETTGMGNIAVGDVIGVGACTITVAEPKDGYDLILEVEQPKGGADDDITLESRSTIGLENTAL